MKEMLGDVFVKGDGSQVSVKELDGKHVGILFSMGWHYQCKG